MADDAAERLGIQLPRTRRIGSRQNATDLAREVVSCNAVLGCARRSPLILQFARAKCWIIG